MNLKITVDDDRFLRIESDDGGAITVYKERTYGHILSLLVQPGDRGHGVGRGLLSAAERELSYCGIQWIDAEYAQAAEALTGFFENNDFSVKPGADILSIPMTELFNSSLVKKSLHAATPGGVQFVPLSSLSFAQWDELIDRFKMKHLRIENQDIVRLEQDLSGVVYDDKNDPQAIVFCSEVEEDLHVDFLFGFGKNVQLYIMASLQGMLSALKERDGAILYRNLTAISINKNVPVLMERALNNGKSPNKAGETLYARKKLLGDYDTADDIYEATDADRKEVWRREIRKIPLQANISYKLSWGRMNGVLLTTKEGEKEKVTAMTINYDKDEDERRGLVMDRTLRITAENLKQFSSALPPDVVRDIIRPFYRGLAVLREEEPVAVMAWCYERLESDRSPDAEILFFNAKTENDGDILLREYTREIQNEGIVRSYFYTQPLSDLEEALLCDAGFSMDKREDITHFLTIDELERVPLLKNKTTHSVVSLGQINDRQFKRGVAKCLYMLREGKSEDLAYLSKGWFDQEVSACFIQDGEVCGMFLTHPLASGDFYIDFVRSLGSDPEIETIYLIRFSLMKLVEKYKKRPRIIIRLDNEEDIRLAERLFSGLNKETACYFERKES